MRNKSWLQPPLFDALRRKNVALAWIDHPWMLTAKQYASLEGAVTSDFLYVRWLGDRYKIEEVTKEWDRVIVDRSRETRSWAEVLREVMGQVQRTYAYYNNHYGGCAFESAYEFERTWEAVSAMVSAPEEQVALAL